VRHRYAPESLLAQHCRLRVVSGGFDEFSNFSGIVKVIEPMSQSLTDGTGR
jgi:hypothetical protein